MVPFIAPLKGADSLIGEAGTITACQRSFVSSVLEQDANPIAKSAIKYVNFCFIILN
jgi:hypothetical protein